MSMNGCFLHAGRSSFAVGAVLALVVASCTDASAPRESSPDVRSAVQSEAHLLVDLRERFVIERQVVNGDEEERRTEPALPKGESFRVERDAGRIRPVWASPVPARGGAALVTLPERANGAFTIQDRTTGLSLEVAHDGASEVEAQVMDGYVTYPSALASALEARGGRGGHLLYRVHPRGVEDYVTVDTAPADPVLRYRVVLGDRVAGLRLVENVLEFVNERHDPRLRVAHPYLVDQAGKQHPATLAVFGCAYDHNPASPWDRPVTPPGARQCVVEVRWSHDGVQYPVLIDPAWTETQGVMTTRRENGSATIIKTGAGAERVLFAGGVARDSAELYNPSTDTFTITGKMPAIFYYHPAVNLTEPPAPNGNVLIYGGWRTSTQLTNNTILYNTAAGTWSARANGSISRQHGLALLGDGKVLATGGKSSTLASAPSTSSARIYDPVGNAWRTTTAMSVARAGHAAATLAMAPTLSMSLVAGGGTNTTERFMYTSSGTELWQPLGNLVKSRGNLKFVRYPLTSSTADLIVFDAVGDEVEYFAGSSWSWVEHSVAPSECGSPVPAFVPGHANWFLFGPECIWESGGGWRSMDPPSVSHSAGSAVPLSTGQVLMAGSSAATNGDVAHLYEPLPNGAACTGPGDCESEVCVDGVCCNEACASNCRACSAAAKHQGTDGTCGLVADGFDPRDVCAQDPQGASSCALDGLCDGAGLCRNYVNGTECQGPNCSGGTLTLHECNGSGLCLSTQSSCTPYTCANASSCRTSCTVNTDCAAGHFCDGGSCGGKKIKGDPCSADAECESNACVDGVCCTDACGGICEACSSLAKGQGADGDCGAVIEGLDPHDSCTPGSPNTCGFDGTCNGQKACKYYQGNSCLGGATCDGNTVKGQFCNGLGTCITNSTGTLCDPYKCIATLGCATSCASDTDCSSSSFYCDQSNCVAKQQLGGGCSADNQCGTGHCVDSVCCENACSSKCQACSTATKGAGENGTCEPILTGLDPDEECDADPASTCGFNGACDGNGGCSLHATGTACGSTACNGNTVVGQVCDGLGSCVYDPAGVSCEPYTCNTLFGTCNAECATAAECVTDHFCQGAACVQKLVNGSGCIGDTDCVSGHCVDDVCCSAECTGQCEACNASGVCEPVVGGPKGDRDPCTVIDGECAGSCDGANTTECSYPSGNLCGSRCLGGSEVERVCDGKGVCRDGTTETSCGLYRCADTGETCLTACDGDEDCASGAACDTVTGLCAAEGSACKDEFTAVSPSGVETNCEPYQCASGVCRDSCSTTNDCASGYACEGSRCALLQDAGAESGSSGTPTVDQDKGCGCRAVGTGPDRGSGAIGVLLLILAAAVASFRSRISTST